MTLSRSNPRAKPRWAVLAGLLVALTMAVGGLVLAADGGATFIPSNYAPFTVQDSAGANDVPGQVDLTQMGRDDTTASTYKLFWSWDSISAWTGQGQTGDACALFDNDGDTFINFVVCIRVENRNADPTDVTIRPTDAGQPAFLFNCSDKKNDRCTNPSPVAYTSDQVQAGALATSPLAQAQNLITHTDPFTAGESYNSDSTVEVHILKTVVPGNEVLVNVCSYPSAGNGGNNNPFDCIVSPGGGFLRIVKQAGPSAPNFTFNASRGATSLANFTAVGSATATVDGTSGATLLPLLVDPNSGANVTVTETNIPSPWELSGVSCKVPPGGASTGAADLDNDRIQQVSIQSGQVTECTFVDQLQTGTLVVIKTVVNDNGGTAVAGDFTYNLNENPDQGSYASETGTESPGQSYTLTAGTGFDVVENAGGPAGYAASYTNSWNSATDCTGTMGAGQTMTCTITNNDNAPSLTLVKVVTNDNGGTAVTTDWTLSASGPTPLSGAGGATSGASFDQGTYDLSESGGPSGYTASDWVCTGTGTQDDADTVSLDLGESATCTITNNDNAPSLTLVKVVVNDNGDDATAADWTLTATGPTGFSGAGPSASSSGSFDAGTYDLSESGPSDYDPSGWVCVGGTQDDADTVTLGIGESATCTITNDDRRATPAGTTVQSWVLHDALTITGIRTGATDQDDATVTFRLYDAAGCAEADLVGTRVDTEINFTGSTGEAATPTGILVTESGTYYWTAEYEGDQYNDGFTTECGDEITQILAKDAYQGGRDDFAP